MGQLGSGGKGAARGQAGEVGGGGRLRLVPLAVRACGQLLQLGDHLGQPGAVIPTAALTRLGGVATLAELRAVKVSRRQLLKAVQAGTVARRAHGRYALAAVEDHLGVAHQLSATLSHVSAALHHGWKVRTAPEKAQLIVRRNRRLSAQDQRRAEVRWRDLAPGDVDGPATSPLRTVLDCARDLPFDEALAVADSALREGDVDPDQLRAAARRLRGPGSARAQRVARHASHLAANPFESVLRALALEAGLDVRPQVQVTDAGMWAMADLVDEGRRLALEADSFEHHGNRKGFRKDVRRYTRMLVFGWTVLRFTWEDVMFAQDWVLWALRSWRLAQEGARVEPPPPFPAHLA